MKVERRILRSISEFSMFKIFLVCYLIFFIIFVILFAIAALIWWAMLATSGVTVAEVLNSILPGTGLGALVGTLGAGMGGGALGIIIFIIVGLIASIFVAAAAALVMWIFNVVLRITGGIELRFMPSIIAGTQAYQAPEPQSKPRYQDYDINRE